MLKKRSRERKQREESKYQTRFYFSGGILHSTAKQTNDYQKKDNSISEIDIENQIKKFDISPLLMSLASPPFGCNNYTAYCGPNAQIVPIPTQNQQDRDPRMEISFIIN